MITNRNIIIFSDDWGRYPSTMQHIGKILAGENRILWIGSLGLRKPNLNLKDLIRAFEKLKKFFNRKVNDEKFPSILQYHPFLIPLHDIKIVRWLNQLLIRAQMKRVLRLNNFSHPLLLSSSPIVGDLVNNLGETSSHYFCLDDYSLFDGAFKSLLKLEKELLNVVDSSFSVSEVLCKSKVPKSGK